MIVGIGTDIVELSRISQVGIDRLVAKILTDREISYLPSGVKRKLEYVAGRFAAKEAIAKAWGTGLGARFAFQDVEIIPDEFGAPIANWVVAGSKPFIHLSISHNEAYAIAMVVMER